MPQILDELAVSLTVEAGRFNQGMSHASREIETMRRQFAAAQGSINRATQRLDAYEREANQAAQAANRTTRALQSQRDVVNTLGRRILGLAAAYIGFRQAAQFIRSSTEAFFEQARATNDLAVALRSAGITGATALQQLEQGALDIQTQFNLADEAITRGTGTISRLNRSLRLPDLQRAQTVLAGLSQLMGDTDTAAQALARGIQGQGRLLQQYGITVNKTGTEQDRLNQIIASPAVQTALVQLAANAKTVEGRVQAAGIAWGEFKETLGGVIVDMATAGEKADSLAGSLDNMRKSIEQNREEWVQTGRIMVAVFTAIPRTILNVVSIAVTGQIHMFEVLRRELSTTMAAIQAIPRGPGAVFQVIALGQQKLFEETRARAIEAVGDLKDIEEAWKGVAAAANAPLGRVGAGKGGAAGGGAGGTGIDPQAVAAARQEIDSVAEALREVAAQEAGFRALRDVLRGTSVEFDPLAERAGMLAGQMRVLNDLMVKFPERAGEIRPTLLGVVAELSSLTAQTAAYTLAAERAQEAQDRLNQELEEMREGVRVRATVAAEAEQGRFERARTEVERFASHVEDAAVSIISRTDSIADAFKQMVQSIIADLARLTLQRAIIGPLVDAIAGSVGGGNTSGGVTEVAGLGTHGRRGFVSASTGRFASPAVAPVAPMTVVMQNTFEVRSIDTREGAQFLQQHAPAIGQLAAREFQKSAGLQSLVRGRR